MDGVLADFKTKKVEVFGTDDIDDHQMWEVIWDKYPRWFLDLEMMPDMWDLLHFLMYDPSGKYKGHDLCVLTALPAKRYEKAITVVHQKRRWLNEQIGDIPMIACIRRHKADYGNKDSILIDDDKGNVNAFRKAGGIVILHTSAKETIKELEKLLPTKGQVPNDVPKDHWVRLKE